MKPILFNTAMVRAIFDGRKTQTRRVIKPQPPEGVDVAMLCNNTRLDGVRFTNNAMTVGQGEDTQWFQSKYLEGDILYVLEPNNYVPKEAARLFLRVTDVRVERVQEASPPDIVAEGAATKHDGSYWGVFPDGEKELQYREAFQLLWNSTVTDPAFNWDANPWVWVYDFERIEKPEAVA